MSVHQIACPECKYVLMYATFGTKGSYKTGSSFEQLCLHGTEIDPLNAMSCPALRPAVENALRVQFPGRDVTR